jgi:hypothetical protein
MALKLLDLSYLLRNPQVLQTKGSSFHKFNSIGDDEKEAED